MKNEGPGAVRAVVILLLGTFMLPLWIVSALAYLIVHAVVAGWLLGEKLLDWTLER